MLATKQPVLKRFWYPVMPIQHLAAAARGFELLGQKIVLWLDGDGNPAAAEDRCCHRTAQLSEGTVLDGQICCPYHGWTFNSEGVCVCVPQLPADAPIPRTYKIQSYRCQARYGYAWVCLTEPLTDIPEIPAASDPRFRQIDEFYERWHCSGLRMMENSFDNAHFSFVHAKTFGDRYEPLPASVDISELDTGICVKTVVPVVNPPLQQKNLRLDRATTIRTNLMTWYMPFCRTLQITYPNNLIHLIFTAATPIDDSTSQIVQFCLRNDTEAEAKASDIVAFDRAVTLEDKAVLEATDYDAPLDLSKEQHMASDKPGILMRHKLAALLKAHGEVEQSRVCN